MYSSGIRRLPALVLSTCLLFLPVLTTPATGQLTVTGTVYYYDQIRNEYLPAQDALVRLEGDWYWRADPETHTNRWGRFRFTVGRPGWPHDIWHGDWDDFNIEAFAETEDQLDIKEHWLALYSYSAESPELDDIPLEGSIEIELRIGGPDNNSVDATRSTAETANAFLAHQEVMSFIRRLRELGAPDSAFDEKDFIIPAASISPMRSYYNHVTGNINIILEPHLTGGGSWANLDSSSDPYVAYNNFKLMLRHEYSHAFHDELTGWGILAGLNIPMDHNASIATNEHVAYTEGFASFLPLVTLGTAGGSLINSWEPTNDRPGTARGILFDPNDNNGWEMEGHVTALLWDFFDNERGETYLRLPSETVNDRVRIPQAISDRMIWTENLEFPGVENLGRLLEIASRYDGAAPVDTIDEFVEEYIERFPDDLHEVKAAAYHRRMIGMSLPPQNGPWFDNELRLSRPAGPAGTLVSLAGIVRELDDEDRSFVKLEIHHESARGDFTFFAGNLLFQDGWEGDSRPLNFSLDLAGDVDMGGFPTGLTTLAEGEILWLVLTDEMTPRVYRLTVPAPGSTTVVRREDLFSPLTSSDDDVAGAGAILSAPPETGSGRLQIPPALEQSDSVLRNLSESSTRFKKTVSELEQMFRAEAEETRRLKSHLQWTSRMFDVRDLAGSKNADTRDTLLLAIDEAMSSPPKQLSPAQQEFLAFSREFLQKIRMAGEKRNEKIETAINRIRQDSTTLAPFLGNDILRMELRSVIAQADSAAANVLSVSRKAPIPLPGNPERPERPGTTRRITYEFRGTVLGSDGSHSGLQNLFAVPGTEMMALANDGTRYQVPIDGNGRFNLHLPPGGYLLEINAPDEFVDQSVTFESRADAPPLDIVLAPSTQRPEEPFHNRQRLPRKSYRDSVKTPPKEPREVPPDTVRPKDSRMLPKTVEKMPRAPELKAGPGAHGAGLASVRLQSLFVPGGEFGDQPHPLANVFVQAIATDARSGSVSGLSGQDGYVTLRLEPGREYEVQFRLSGFRPETILVRADKDLERQIVLQYR